MDFIRVIELITTYNIYYVKLDVIDDASLHCPLRYIGILIARWLW